jgi:26S proteasome regulatory subunit N3
MTAAAAEIDDIEMASETEEKEAEEKKEGEKKDPNLLSVEDIREHCKLIKRSVETKEPRFVLRVLRSLPATRKKTNAIVLRTIVKGFFTCNEQEKEKLLEYVENAAELEGVPQLLRGKNASTPLIPEVDSYLSLLVLIHLIDNKKANMAVDCAAHLMTKLESQNRRTMDMISSKCYFYYVRSYEMVGRLAETRDVLHSRLRTATLRNDFEGQAVLINCLLRNYLHYNLYNQADKLVLKSTFPEQASNNEWARYYYYLGRIKATQLDYSVAHKHLLQSSRKAPQNSAAGFRQHVAKLSVTVELLLGNIPERSSFLAPQLKKALAPYLQLTQAVKSGDLIRFGEVLENFRDQFVADHTYTLILRLHHNVVKTAVRTISLAYTRITFADIAQKLLLDSPEDAEFIVAKAIRDGVIEAVLDHENGWMQSKDTSDIYSTKEPQLAFNQRIEFCLDLHNHSVKAMRFPPKSYNKELESAEDRREREAQDLELAKEMAEDDDDAY